MSPQHEERIVLAVEMLATAMTSIAKTYELTYYRAHTPKRPPRDIEITRPLTPEEELRQSQGATGETNIKDWMTLNESDEEEIGPRERTWLEEERRRRGAERSAEGGTGDAPGQSAGAGTAAEVQRDPRG
jgi:hypothetical protein